MSIARERDFAREYARRKELAAERGLEGAAVTAAARGRTPEGGVGMGVLRDIGRAADAGRDVFVVESPASSRGAGRLVLVVEGSDGKYRTRYLPAGITRQRFAAILEAAGLPDPETTG